MTVSDEIKPQFPKRFTYKIVMIGDKRSADLKEHFMDCFKFIDEFLDQGLNVLVHCMAGASRSATVVIAYLMWKKNLSL